MLPRPAAALLTLLAAPTAAQLPPRTVALPHEWSPGQRYRVDVVKESETHVGGRLVSRLGSRSTIDVEVLRRDADGYVVRWTLGPAELLDGVVADPLAERIVGLQAGLVLDLRTDALGTPVELVNPGSYREFFLRAERELHELVAERGVSAELLEHVRRHVEALLSPETLQTIALKEAALYYLPCGATYAVDSPLAYEDELQNPLGGEPFPSRAQLLVRSVDRELSEVVIEWTQTLDPERTRAVLLATLARIAARGGAPPPAGDQLPAFDITDRATYVLDLESGLPRSVHHEREVHVGEQRKVERYVFTTSAAEPR